MKEFLYGSPEFRTELAKSAHAAGEVEFLESIAKPGMRAIEIGGNHGVTAAKDGSLPSSLSLSTSRSWRGTLPETTSRTPAHTNWR